MTIAIISHPTCAGHESGFGHPECPERVKVIAEALAHSDINSQLRYETANLVSKEQLMAVHDADYVADIFQRAPSNGLVYLDPETAMNPGTLTAALYAAGAVVDAVDLVLSNQVQAAFCNIRPPGHHAERNRAMGFCFFNNVAVGVAHAINHHHIKRIAIVDFDVHRGNGTEDIFQDQKKVLICSIYEQFLFPIEEPTIKADNILYIPLASGTTARDYRAEVSQYALDKIAAFKPELLFFSAGFDAHQADLISHLNLTEADYYWITQQFSAIQPRIVSVLEGGYALDVLGAAVVAHLKGLLTI